jgi:DNA-binding NtrC family response regulator
MSSDDRVCMSILVIDDDPKVLESVGAFLQAQGHRVHLSRNGSEGLEALRREGVDIVITDIRMPGVDGFEVLREVRRASPGAEVIMITGYRDLENAFRAVREGAFDFFTKPFKVQDLSASLQRTVRFQALRREKERAQARLDRLGAEERGRYGLSALIGEGPAMQQVRDLIRQVCRTEATTVLVCGETGTGKELVARAIHHESGRAGGPFVAVDCSAIPEPLVESAFYGHVKGAFTDAREAHAGYFEQADGGTLFLDEVGDMGLGMQGRLLRTLEERRVRPVGGAREVPVDVRVVSATNRDLPRAVAQGGFREDLYYRLNAFTIRAPSLRERPEDILPLAGHFLARYARELRKPIEGFTPGALALLQAHSYPGNIRELRNLVERAAILCRTEWVAPGDLEFDRAAGPAGREGGPATASSAPAFPTDLPGLLRNLRAADLKLSVFEKEITLEALRRCGGNQVLAAELLGLSRTAFRRRMARFKLRASDFRVQGPE